MFLEKKAFYLAAFSCLELWITLLWNPTKSKPTDSWTVRQLGVGCLDTPNKKLLRLDFGIPFFSLVGWWVAEPLLRQSWIFCFKCLWGFKGSAIRVPKGAILSWFENGCLLSKTRWLRICFSRTLGGGYVWFLNKSFNPYIPGEMI